MMIPKVVTKMCSVELLTHVLKSILKSIEESLSLSLLLFVTHLVITDNGPKSETNSLRYSPLLIEFPLYDLCLLFF